MDKLSSDILTLYSERGHLKIGEVALLFSTNILAVVDPMSSLKDQGYLAIDPLDIAEHGDMITQKVRLHITQQGKDKLFEMAQEQKWRNGLRLRDWIHIALTAVAVVISIIAIILSVR